MKVDLEGKKIASLAQDVLDTIAAISTPPGPGGVGMVRITGPGAMKVAERIFSPRGKVSMGDVMPRRALLGQVHYPECPDSSIDQAILLFFKEPHSYTGEDTIEITTHGGPLILGALLEAAVMAGARLAEPGEFTRRAFMNGRIDLSQAESVASLIFAATDQARRVMLKQVEGAMGREAGLLREGLMEVKVALEAAIDFPEDAGEIQPEDLIKVIESVQNRAKGLLDTAKEGIAMTEGLRIVIAGAPNVGKSSLLNALLQEDRAIVHEVAGTTRDFIEGRISVHGIPLIVVDTAGIRDAEDSLEGEGISRTKNLMDRADMLIIVLDGSRELIVDERVLLEETISAKRVIAINKCDLSPCPGLKPPEGSVSISAITGQGIDALKGSIRDIYIGEGKDLNDNAVVVTSYRQAEALTRIRDGCGLFLQGLNDSRGLELLALDLEEALLGVGELTGEITRDEVLEEIFSRFCIGK